jgi:hypothetical protein
MKILKQIIVVIWVFLVFIVIPTPSAVGGDEKKSGKELYKKDCRVCHLEDSPHGDFTPMSLTQDQWKTFFKETFTAKHKDVIFERENKKLLEYMTTGNLKKIEKFCVKHAADSEQPQTCSD